MTGAEPAPVTAGVPDPVRRETREPYGGTPVEADQAKPDAAPSASDVPAALGSFEQRLPAARESAVGGEVRSRASLRAALLARIAADPQLAGLDLDLEVGAQGVRLRGQHPSGAVRERTRALIAEAGLGPVDDDWRGRGNGTDTHDGKDGSTGWQR